MDTTTDTTTDDVHVCPCCGITVKNRRTFNDHIETHSDVEYCCEQCGKVFASKRRMYRVDQKKITTFTMSSGISQQMKTTFRESPFSNIKQRFVKNV